MKKASYTLSFCSLMAALGAAVLLTGGLIPVATYCAPLLASLLLIPVTEEFGEGCGWRVWVVTAVLVLLLGADKEAAFFYLLLGYYPLLRLWLEKKVPKALRLPAKLGWSALSVAVMYALLCLVFRVDAVLQDFAGVSMWVNAAFALLLCVVMLLFDRCLGPMTLLYRYKLRPRLGRKK